MKNIKKYVIVLFIAFFSTTIINYTVLATPQEDQKKKVEDSRTQLNDVNEKINELQNQINSLDDKILPLAISIEKNKENIDKLKTQIEQMKVDIENTKEDITKKELIVSNRFRAIYKWRPESNYINIILNAKSLGDFISSFEECSRITSMDKKIIIDLNEKKEQLNNKIEDIKEEQDNINKLNMENKLAMNEFNAKKIEQQKLVEDYNESKKNIAGNVEVAERELIEYFTTIINNSSSTIEELKSSIDGLNNSKNQIKTEAVTNELNTYIAKAKSEIAIKEKAYTAAAKNASGGGTVVIQGGSSNVGSVLAYAQQFLGLPYVWGATGPSAFDCSGFTQHVFGKFGITLPRTTYDQVRLGSPVSYEQLKPGDLVFERKSSNGPEHVGIYIGGGKIIHAANSAVGIIIGPIYQFSEARRIL